MDYITNYILISIVKCYFQEMDMFHEVDVYVQTAISQWKFDVCT